MAKNLRKTRSPRSPAKASRPAARRTPAPARKSRAAPTKAKGKKMNDKDKHEHDKPAPHEVKPPAAKEPLAGGSKGATTTESTALPPEAYMTEQEKAALKPAAKKETK